eukprot:CAMPEP_0194418674 /NCGR_PEP_ID=MMETSP0176-20130528/17827_1 /TAXON_ID=216777 /ORGANISM="Proboscia alata, Strain PI-D3" /LENGTH=871 /DNA_ID=CAMNT_0039225275 /DNA_START=117 /DNA_END=2732 /DNA_ORIENTATION=-
MATSRWKSSLVPDSSIVCNEFYIIRKLNVAQSLLGKIRSALTATSLLFAIGVGDPLATPMNYLLISELNSLFGRVLGLCLSSFCSTALLAEYARLVLTANVFLNIISMLFPILLMVDPSRLAMLTMAETLFNTAKAVCVSPASAALSAHLLQTADPAKRAEVNSAISNQNKFLSLVNIAIKLAVVSFVENGIDTDHIWKLWLALCLAILPLDIYSIYVHQPTTLNWERFRIVLGAWEEIRKGPSLADLSFQLSPATTATKERLLSGLFPEEWKVELGVALDEALVPLHDNQNADAAKGLQLLLNAHREDGYILGTCMKSRRLRVVLKEGKGDEAQLVACLHAHKVAQILQNTTSSSEETLSGVVSIILSAKEYVQHDWPKLRHNLSKAGWRIDYNVICSGEWRLMPYDQSSVDSTIHLRQRRPRGSGTYSHRSWLLFRCINGTTELQEKAIEIPTENVLESSIVAIKGAMLPIGYPGSVAEEYMQYQLWDTLQVMMSELRSIIIRQANLIGLGIGLANASPMGTVLTDCAVEVLGTCLGLFSGMTADPRGSAAAMKSWRIYNTISSIARCLLTLVNASFPRRRFYTRCAITTISNLMAPRGAGASEAVVMHLSKNSLSPAFIADVESKESNQDRLLGLLLLPARIGLIFWVGTDVINAWSVAILLSGLHIILNAMAVRVLVLKTFNNERLRQVLTAWEIGNKAPAQLTPSLIASRERLIPDIFPKDWEVDLGVALDQALVALNKNESSAEWLKLLLNKHQKDAYVLGACLSSRRLRVVLKEGADDEAQLMACLHAHKVAKVLRTTPLSRYTLSGAVNVILSTKKNVQVEWPILQANLEMAGWNITKEAMHSGRSCILNPGPQRMKYQLKQE